MSIRWLLLISVAACGQAPVERVWIRSAANAEVGVRRMLPEVQEVRVSGERVEVESAGLSMQSFGPLQSGPVNEAAGTRRFRYSLPRSPKAGGSPLPVGVIGTFINGVPIWNLGSTLSWQDQNLWHVDRVAFADDGQYTATGRPLPGMHGLGSPALLNALLARNGEHSPVIGFALDGYPIYGPYGWDSRGVVKRMRSSFRLRKMSKRVTLVDGTVLTPAQEGPAVGGEYPAGTFVEDYEFAGGSGDLDEHNGRFAVTPEFPSGTYAYFLSTNEAGRMTFPYLVGSSFYGKWKGLPDGLSAVGVSQGLELSSSVVHARAGEDVRWVFRTAAGPLERVHEKTLHVLVISKDLAKFEHVHPEPVTSQELELVYRFSQPGQYWVFADYTPGGGTQTIARFEVEVTGKAQAALPERAGLRVKFEAPARVAAGADVELAFDVGDVRLERYLGAWGHIMILSEDGSEFIHAHPFEEAAPQGEAWTHSHGPAGSSPARIVTTTGFRKPGRYRVWLQVQKDGQVITESFPLIVVPREGRPVSDQFKDAIPVEISSAGYAPARIPVPAGAPVRIAFHREDAQNCGGKVVFPTLGREFALPAGQTTLVELPALSEGTELTFTCGMRMMRGAVLAQSTSESR